MAGLDQTTEQLDHSRTWLLAEFETLRTLSSDAIVHIDAEGAICSWNPAAERLFLAKGPETIGRHVSSLLPGLAGLLSQASPSGSGYVGGEMNAFRQDGTVVPCDVRVAPRQDPAHPGHLVAIRNLAEAGSPDETLRQINDRFRSIVDNAVEGIFQTTPAGRLLTANPALAQILGYPDAETLLATVTDFGRQLYIHPEQHLALRQTLDTQGFIRAFEAEFYRRDARRIWVSLSGRTVRNADGTPRYYEGMLEDITDRKRHAERLSQINDCFLRFGNNPNENITRLTALCGTLLSGLKAEYCVRDQGRLISVARWPAHPPFSAVEPSEQAYHAEVIARGGEEVFHKTFSGEQGMTGSALRERGLPLTFVGRAVRRHGGELGSLAVVRSECGAPSESDRRLMGIIVSAIGVEEQRRHAQQTLRDAYKDTELILSSLPNGILIVDRRQIVLWANPLAQQYLGDGQDPLIHRKLPDLLPESEARRIRHAQPSWAAGAEAGYWRHDRQFERGESVYRYRCFPVAGYRGTQPQTGLVIWDVTEEKRLLDQLIQAEKLASLGTMVSGMAHEINNPAQAILGLAELITGEVDALKAREYATDIATHARHVGSVVRDFCFYARATSRVGETNLDVTQCLIEAVKMVRRGPHFGHVEVITHFSSTPPLKARANEIEQIFVNIISNALQAMKGQGCLTLRTLEQRGSIHVSIGDTGCGIPRALLRKIFDPFFTTKGPGQGTGIGLSIAHRIVAKYGGRMTVESEENVGTTFTIQFPIRSEAQGGIPWEA